MAPERVAHGRTKGLVYIQLREAIKEAKPNCEAFPDGMAVRVDDFTV